MSITQIDTDIKQNVLLTLLSKGEEFTVACSKAGLCMKDAKKFLIINN
jgi:hypothetical protein